jgi:hypothetical protein
MHPSTKSKCRPLNLVSQLSVTVSGIRDDQLRRKELFWLTVYGDFSPGLIDPFALGL